MGEKPTRHKAFVPVIRIVLAGVLVAGMGAMAGCLNSQRTGQDAAFSVSHVDGTQAAQEAKRLLPGLEGIESADIEQIKYGGTQPSDFVPTPTDYYYQGYVELSDEAARKYASSYDFVEGTVPQVDFQEVIARDGKWLYSYEFDKAVIGERSIGNLWLDGNTVLFSLHTV